MNSLKSIYKFISEHIKTIMFICMLTISIFLIFSVRSCNNNKNEANSLKNSFEALYDKISYYKGKNDELVASKKILEGNIELLKINNKELYDKLESIKQKDVDNVVYVETIVDNPPDTIYWEIDKTQLNDTIKYFNFNNDWRVLEGYITYTPSQLGLNITKDQVYFDYMLTMKGNEVFMTSSNPYVKYKEITGLTVPTYTHKKKHWGIGPVIYGGYDLNRQKLGWGVGIGIMYNIWNF